MTHATDIRDQVLTLDDHGIPATHIAHALGIPLTRVDRILDDHDAAQGCPHPHRDPAPVLEPLGGPAVIVSQAAVGGGGRKDPQQPRRATAGQKPTREVREIVCGTLSGYYKHRRDNTPRCGPCRQAYNESDRAKRPRKTSVPYQPATPVECGTVQGHRRHKRNGEEPCHACRDAYNRGQRDRWKRTGGVSENPAKPIAHGTPAGYNAHRRRGETPCDDCRTAWNQWKLENKAKKKEVS